ncbi:hypothetical protein AB0K43_07855 [Kitasatospora sp. NPDC049258]|uniref:hypothetical protein n=1 Tax=Kitasatospora sp. NPDC049258 TaxID=3155394 RepID=UPI00343A7AE4
MRSAGWVEAWTGGRRAVHIGDVADFNAQFIPQTDLTRRQGHHYSCLAAFYSPQPAVLVLPHQVEEGWVRLLERELGWPEVEVHSGLVGDDGLMAPALAARPALRHRIGGLGLPVHHWGRSGGVDATGAPARADGVADGAAGAAPVDPRLAAVRHYEAKDRSHALFHRLAPEHPGILVPAQQPARPGRRLAALVAERAARGLPTVLKARHGVGGFGTAVLTPAQVAAAGGAKALLRDLTGQRILPPATELLVEEYVAGGGRLRHPSFDGLVDEDGGVHPVGVALMDVEGTGYRGATVGPGLLPAQLGSTATAFGLAVGRELAAAGHRGWYDVDFVTGRDGRLSPTEINLRLTGPAAAFMLKARLDAVRGPGHLVRTIDQLPLGARLGQQALLAHLERLAERCARFGAALLPTIPTAGFEPAPTVGVALAATVPDALDAAEAVVRAANLALGDPFAPLGSC